MDFNRNLRELNCLLIAYFSPQNANDLTLGNDNILQKPDILIIISRLDYN
jgi:hypothetical protein